VKWAALAFAGLATSAHAMDPDRAMSQYGRERWGTDRGFPGGTGQASSQTEPYTSSDRLRRVDRKFVIASGRSGLRHCWQSRND